MSSEQGPGEETERTARDDLTEPAEPPATLATPERRIGRYRVDAPLGAGGMAEVFAAYDTVLHRHVALKILHPTGSGDEAQQRRRVLREARAAAALTHPNTVTIFDVGESEGVVFIAMELLEGETLRSALARDVSVAQKLDWLLDAARALSEAHERGLVHRDVKPENMFVCDDGALKLLDFGIAKRDELEGEGGDDALGPSSLRTVEGRLVGTPRYMAPEQKRGEPTDARTDQYAWGLVAFELLTGIQPISGVETEKMSAGAADDTTAFDSPHAARLREVEGVGEEVARAISRALAPRKEDRFDSMSPIVVLLEAQRGAPISAASAPPATAVAQADAGEAARAHRPPARRARARWLVGGAALASAALVAAIVVRARRAAEGPEPAGPPACSVERTREFSVGKADRITLLPGGALVVVRAAGRDGRPVYERELDGRLVPFDPFHSLPVNDRGAPIGAATWRDAPSLLVTSRNEGVSMLSTAERIEAIHRHGSHTEALAVAEQAVTSFGRGVAAVYAYRAFADSAPSGGGLDIIPLGVPSTRAPAPQLRASTPFFVAIAATDTRIGITFASGGALKFALAEPSGRLSGDVIEVAKGAQASALAFAGDSAVAFWAERRGETMRLLSATLPVGAAAFTAPAIAARGAVAPIRPVAGRLASGAAAVVWVSVANGVHTVRLAPVRETGDLGASTTAGTGKLVRDPSFASTAKGADVAWVDDAAHVARVASLACAAP